MKLEKCLQTIDCKELKSLKSTKIYLKFKVFQMQLLTEHQNDVYFRCYSPLHLEARSLLVGLVSLSKVYWPSTNKRLSDFRPRNCFLNKYEGLSRRTVVPFRGKECRQMSKLHNQRTLLFPQRCRECQMAELLWDCPWRKVRGYQWLWKLSPSCSEHFMVVF